MASKSSKSKCELKRRDSSASSSTESVNSIPITSDDEDLPPLHLDKKGDIKRANKNSSKKKPPPRPSDPPPPDVIRKIVATNSIELDEITANTIPKRSRDKVKKVPIIPESFENKVEKSEKTITGPTILNNFKSSNLSKESGQTKALPEDNIQPNLENSESEVSNTPKWKKLVDTSSGIWQTSATKISSSKANVSNTFSSVVQLAKKAALDTKHKMGPAADRISLIHFNDVYNVEPRTQKPEGGAARFCTAVKSFSHLNPMILFSGDVFAPSILSTFTKGEQMVPVLNKLGTHCAVFGNHDFDFGIDTLMELVEKTNFPWLMSNVIDNETGRPLADGKISHTFDWWGRKIGLIGLVEKEWLDTLSTIHPEEVTFTDFVEAGSMLARELKSKGCHCVFALTHMRTPNDIRLAENVPEIDLILGGHDHVYEKKKVNGTWILKSGTDFRQFSVVTLDFTTDPIEVAIEAVDVSSDVYDEDADLVEELKRFSGKMDDELIKELGEFDCDLEGRFSFIRTRETNLGNFICDIMVAATNADFALLNSGTFRSDMVHPAGPFYVKDLVTILPMIDPLVLIEITGSQILDCLENGVCQWPKLEGRFPQVSGIRFAFDGQKPPGKRIDQEFVKIGDEYLHLGKTYRMVTKAYLANGKDGYDVLANCHQIIDEENAPRLTFAVQNHFRALAMREGRTRRSSVHHQSLVTLSRRASIVRQLTEDGTHHLPAYAPEKSKLTKQTTVVDLEALSLNPQVEGRIIEINDKTLPSLEAQKRRDLKGWTVKEEDESETEEKVDLT